MGKIEVDALALLRKLTGVPGAEFRPHQFDAIQALVKDRKRVLLVQRTGWGKSAVYFIATRLLRDQGAGPTLLVSPLLALMRNQIEAAERMGWAPRPSTAPIGTTGTRCMLRSKPGESIYCLSPPNGSPTRSSARMCCLRSVAGAVFS